MYSTVILFFKFISISQWTIENYLIVSIFCHQNKRCTPAYIFTKNDFALLHIHNSNPEPSLHAAPSFNLPFHYYLSLSEFPPPLFLLALSLFSSFFYPSFFLFLSSSSTFTVTSFQWSFQNLRRLVHAAIIVATWGKIRKCVNSVPMFTAWSVRPKWKRCTEKVCLMNQGVLSVKRCAVAQEKIQIVPGCTIVTKNVKYLRLKRRMRKVGRERYLLNQGLPTSKNLKQKIMRMRNHPHNVYLALSYFCKAIGF